MRVPGKILVIRLSSLGDVIISAASLSAAQTSLPSGVQLDWLVAREFAEVLSGHPRLRKVIPFERRSGVRGLMELARQIRAEGYSEIWDLHSSLRSRFLWFYLRVTGESSAVQVAWRKVPKDKWRHLLFVAIKGRLPKWLRPRSKRSLAAACAGGSGAERADLTHLLTGDLVDFSRRELAPSPSLPLMAVMPASAWEGKCWPIGSFEAVCASLNGRVVPVIFGAERDAASRELVERLMGRGIAHLDGVGRWSLPQGAAILSRCAFYLGNDTGLAHLAEAVGTPAWVIHGPTSPELGFGPSHPESRVLSVDLNCRPCGKDGRICWRWTEPRACLRRLTPNEVVRQIAEVLPRMALRN